MDLGLKGRVALVMGASQGIGYGIAAALKAEGAAVVVSSSSQERTDAAAERLGAQGIQFDAREPEKAAELIETVKERFGAVEVLITNSGGPPSSPDALSFTGEQYQAAYRSLVQTPLALLEAAVPDMQRQGFGRIVNVSSSTVREVAPNLMLSNTHRSAALAAFKTVARQIASSGVTVNSVLPGRIATQRLFDLYGSQLEAEQMAVDEIPAGRLGSVEEFAAAVTFLCSNQASYITGTALLVDGGLTKSI